MNARMHPEALAAVVVGIAGLAGCGDQHARGPVLMPKPNIIFILADDLGYGDLGCYGQEKIQTPNIDAMAREGMLFTQHYSGSTVCAPSRCSLMTGKHTGHCTVRGNIPILMKPGEETLGTVLKRAGYATGCIGKWGVGHWSSPTEPSQFGFDYHFGYLSMWHAHMSYPEFLYRNGQKVMLRNVVKHPEAHYQKGQEALTGYAVERHDYAPDLFTDEALAFMDRNRSQPFFLFYCNTIPHANNEALDDLKQPGMEVPDLGPYKDKDWPEAEKAKAALITRLDGYIGRIMAKVKELGLEDRTLVMMTSDNGPHKEGGTNPTFFASSGPLRGTKRDLYEGGIRVPLIARWPGSIRAGTRCDFVSAFWDVLPTFADLAQVPVPPGMDGRSLSPVLLGKPQIEHEYLYWEFHEGASAQAVRMGQWKAVRPKPTGPIELYDLSLDVGERNNVADRHPEVLAKVETIFSQARTDAHEWPLRSFVPPVK